MILIVILTLVLIIGCVLLSKGAITLIEGARGMAARFRVSPAVVGITVVAIGTTIPEFVVSLFAAVEGKPDIALGNLVGSNIVNIGLIAALSASFAPLVIGAKEFKKELSFMLAAPFLLLWLGFDGVLGRMDGAVLLIGAVLFYALVIKRIRDGRIKQMFRGMVSAPGPKNSSRVPLLQSMFGLMAVIVGAYITVGSGVALARLLGVPEVAVALSIVAIGTSLPELAVAILSQIKKHGDVSLGNIVGSNIVNIFLILGVVAVFAPISVNPTLLRFDIPVMLLFSLLLCVSLLEFGKLKRREAVVFLILYMSYVWYSFLKYYG